MPVRPGAGSGERQRRGPVLVLFDGSPAADRALALGAHLAQSGKRRLVVYRSDGSETDQLRLRERLQTGFGQAPPELRRLPSTGVQQFLEAGRCEAASLLILADRALDEPEAVRVLEQRLDRPAVIVR